MFMGIEGIESASLQAKLSKESYIKNEFFAGMQQVNASNSLEKERKAKLLLSKLIIAAKKAHKIGKTYAVERLLSEAKRLHTRIKNYKAKVQTDMLSQANNNYSNIDMAANRQNSAFTKISGELVF